MQQVGHGTMLIADLRLDGAHRLPQFSTASLGDPQDSREPSGSEGNSGNRVIGHR
jgi:hypothetical protein